MRGRAGAGAWERPSTSIKSEAGASRVRSGSSTTRDEDSAAFTSSQKEQRTFKLPPTDSTLVAPPTAHLLARPALGDKEGPVHVELDLVPLRGRDSLRHGFWRERVDGGEGKGKGGRRRLCGGESGFVLGFEDVDELLLKQAWETAVMVGRNAVAREKSATRSHREERSTHQTPHSIHAPSFKRRSRSPSVSSSRSSSDWRERYPRFLFFLRASNLGRSALSGSRSHLAQVCGNTPSISNKNCECAKDESAPGDADPAA